VGQTLAFGFGLIGLFTNPFLLFIAFFVWMGAAGEASMAQMKASLSGIPVSRAMITDFRTLSTHDPLQRAIDYVLAGFQQDFPVLESGTVVGILVRDDLVKAVAGEGAEARVGNFMRREFETADPAEMLETAFLRLQSCACRSFPVLRNGNLVGLLTTDNVGEFLMIQAALDDVRRAPSPA
jgi:predicted transcriptional regulator